jgi:monoamine oxidase
MTTVMHERDVVVVGAGAAGLVAAQQVAAAGRSVVVVEARGRVGGRAVTRHEHGFPLDLGCGWLHSADENEWTEIAARRGCTIDRTPPPWNTAAYDVGFPAAEQGEFRADISAFFGRVAAAAADDPADRPAVELLQPGGRFNPLIDAISTYANGVELAELSVQDFARYRDSGVNWRVVEGYGALIAGFAAGLDVALDCPVSAIDHSGIRLRVVTAKGDIAASAVIVTVPPGLIADGSLRFIPDLPAKRAAAQGLPLGLADKVFLRIDRPELLPRERRLFGAIDRTATGSYHLGPFGRPLIEGYFGGRFARALEEAGDGAMAQQAIDEVVAQLGGDMRRHLAPLVATAWGRDPQARGSYSYARIGHAAARAALAEPVDGRLFFAGEACAPADFSTAHGAYRSGLAAAAALTHIRAHPAHSQPLSGGQRPNALRIR